MVLTGGLLSAGCGPAGRGRSRRSSRDRRTRSSSRTHTGHASSACRVPVSASRALSPPTLAPSVRCRRGDKTTTRLKVPNVLRRFDSKETSPMGAPSAATRRTMPAPMPPQCRRRSCDPAPAARHLQAMWRRPVVWTVWAVQTGRGWPGVLVRAGRPAPCQLARGAVRGFRLGGAWCGGQEWNVCWNPWRRMCCGWPWPPTGSRSAGRTRRLPRLPPRPPPSPIPPPRFTLPHPAPMLSSLRTGPTGSRWRIATV